MGDFFGQPGCECCTTPPPPPNFTATINVVGCCVPNAFNYLLDFPQKIDPPTVEIRGPNPATTLICPAAVPIAQTTGFNDYVYTCSFAGAIGQIYTVTVNRPGFAAVVTTFTITSVTSPTNRAFIQVGGPSGLTSPPLAPSVCGACDRPMPETLYCALGGTTIPIVFDGVDKWVGSGYVATTLNRVGLGATLPGGRRVPTNAGPGSVSVRVELTANSCGSAALAVKAAVYGSGLGCVPSYCEFGYPPCTPPGCVTSFWTDQYWSTSQGMSEIVGSPVCYTGGGIGGGDILTATWGGPGSIGRIDDGTIQSGSCNPVYFNFSQLRICNLLTGAIVTA